MFIKSAVSVAGSNNANSGSAFVRRGKNVRTGLTGTPIYDKMMVP